MIWYGRSWAFGEERQRKIIESGDVAVIWYRTTAQAGGKGILGGGEGIHRLLLALKVAGNMELF